MNFYSVVGMPFQVITEFECDEWQKFWIKESDYIFFRMELLHKIEEIHGLENFEVPTNMKYIIRRGGDVMVADNKWRNEGVKFSVSMGKILL